jgi:hypothetical protein
LYDRSFMDVQPVSELFDSLSAPQLTRYLAGLTVYVAVAQHAPFSSAASFRASSGVPRSASRILTKARMTRSASLRAGSDVDSRSPDRSPVSQTDYAVYPTASRHVVFI